MTKEENEKLAYEGVRKALEKAKKEGKPLGIKPRFVHFPEGGVPQGRGRGLRR